MCVHVFPFWLADPFEENMPLDYFMLRSTLQYCHKISACVSTHQRITYMSKVVRILQVQVLVTTLMTHTDYCWKIQSRLIPELN